VSDAKGKPVDDDTRYRRRVEELGLCGKYKEALYVLCGDVLTESISRVLTYTAFTQSIRQAGTDLRDAVLHMPR